jgi:hypothetical protein
MVTEASDILLLNPGCAQNIIVRAIEVVAVTATAATASCVEGRSNISTLCH